MTDPAGVTMIPVKDAAERFGVSPQTMRNWCKEGHVPGAEQQGRKWLVPEHAVPEGVRLPSRPTVMPDTSDLRPKTDEEIVEALSNPVTQEEIRAVQPSDDQVRDALGALGYSGPEVDKALARESSPESEEDPLTLADVRESLANMREALNALGSMVGGLHDQVCVTLEMVESLIDQGTESEDEETHIPSPPDLVPGKDGPLLDDAQALEYLTSGQSTTRALETLDEVADTEPPVEIDTDPRMEWELSEAAISHE